MVKATLVPSARGVAASVVARVLGDRAFAAAALDAELARSIQLESRDRALATELVYGTLRLLPWLESRLDRHCRRPVAGLEPLVRAHLDLAAYQIFVLARVPVFAAVSEAVTGIRAARGSKMAGFANAVLRKLASEPRPTAEALAQAAFEAVDPDLRASIVRVVGNEAALGLLGGVETAPPSGIRIEDAAQRETWLGCFRAARPAATFELGRVSPHAIVARGAGKLVDLPGYEEGAWTPQEEGSSCRACRSRRARALARRASRRRR